MLSVCVLRLWLTSEVEKNLRIQTGYEAVQDPNTFLCTSLGKSCKTMGLNIPVTVPAVCHSRLHVTRIRQGVCYLYIAVVHCLSSSQKTHITCQPTYQCLTIKTLNSTTAHCKFGTVAFFFSFFLSFFFSRQCRNKQGQWRARKEKLVSKAIC